MVRSAFVRDSEPAVTGPTIPELSAQPGTSKSPVPFDCHDRNAERLGDLGDGHAAEVPQGDDLA